MRKRKDKPVKVRDEDMKAMLLRNGDGRHGGTARDKNRRDRKATRQQLRKEDF